MPTQVLSTSRPFLARGARGAPGRAAAVLALALVAACGRDSKECDDVTLPEAQRVAACGRACGAGDMRACEVAKLIEVKRAQAAADSAQRAWAEEARAAEARERARREGRDPGPAPSAARARPGAKCQPGDPLCTDL